MASTSRRLRAVPSAATTPMRKQDSSTAILNSAEDDRVDQLLELLRRVDLKLDILLTANGARRADTHVLAAIAAVFGEARFTSRDVFDKARDTPQLAGALLDAWIESPRELGKLLGKMTRTIAGTVDVQRLRSGAWRVMPMSHRDIGSVGDSSA
jgi:hypothetical protein